MRKLGQKNSLKCVANSKTKVEEDKINLQEDGNKAKPYQVHQVCNVIIKYKLDSWGHFPYLLDRLLIVKWQKMVFEEEIEAIIADNRYRQRDPAFKTAVRHKNSVDKRKTKKSRSLMLTLEYGYDRRFRRLIWQSLYV